jgi:phytol kinase
MILVCVTLAAMVGALKLAERFSPPHPELFRKLSHVGAGLVVVSFPWLFARSWPVVVLAGGSVAIIAAVKWMPRLRDGVGSIVTAVERPSLGEVCFPIAIVALTLLSRGDKLLYAIPMLIMTLADAAAALIGITYGKVRYVTSEGLKSAEGSIAFMSIAFMSVHVPLLLCTDIPRTQTLLISMLIAILSMLIEAIAARGLDNLLIPLGTFAFLRLYAHASVHALVIRLIAALAMLTFALSVRLRSTMNDSALIACALFGYGAAMLGGPLWLIGPIVLFLLHVLLWPRFGAQRHHTVSAVASVTLAALVWLILRAADGGRGWYFLPYAVGFGAHLGIIGTSRIAVDPSPRRRSVRLSYALVAGWALLLMQIVPALCASAQWRSNLGGAAGLVAVGLCCVALGTIGFYVMLPHLYGPSGSDNQIHAVGFGSALFGSVCALGLEMFVSMLAHGSGSSIHT